MSEALSRRVRLSYASGAVANGSFLVFGGLNLFFYDQIVGVPAHLVSLALSVTIVIDALWDPLIGHSSDRLRSRWGRRHPFIYAGIALIPIALYLRWHPPAAWPVPALFWYVLGSGLFVNLAYSLYEVPSGALTPELAPGYHQRTVLVSQRWAFGAFGTGIATVLVYGVFLRPTLEFPVGQLNRAGYGPMSLAIAALMTIAALTLALGTRKKATELHQPPEVQPAGLKAQLDEVWVTLKNRNFVVALLASVVAGLGTGLTSGLTLYFNTYFWELRTPYAAGDSDPAAGRCDRAAALACLGQEARVHPLVRGRGGVRASADAAQAARPVRIERLAAAARHPRGVPVVRGQRQHRRLHPGDLDDRRHRGRGAGRDRAQGRRVARDRG